MDNEFFQVIIEPEAEDDLKNIYNYIFFVLKSKQNAVSQLSRIRDEIYKLDFMPESYHLYPKEPFHSRGLRYFKVDNFEIFYIVNKQKSEVHVLRVMQGTMDFSAVWK